MTRPIVIENRTTWTLSTDSGHQAVFTSTGEGRIHLAQLSANGKTQVFREGTELWRLWLRDVTSGGVTLLHAHDYTLVSGVGSSKNSITFLWARGDGLRLNKQGVERYDGTIARAFDRSSTINFGDDPALGANHGFVRAFDRSRVRAYTIPSAVEVSATLNADGSLDFISEVRTNNDSAGPLRFECPVFAIDKPAEEADATKTTLHIGAQTDQFIPRPWRSRLQLALSATKLIYFNAIGALSMPWACYTDRAQDTTLTWFSTRKDRSTEEFGVGGFDSHFEASVARTPRNFGNPSQAVPQVAYSTRLQVHSGGWRESALLFRAWLETERPGFWPIAYQDRSDVSPFVRDEVTVGFHGGPIADPMTVPMGDDAGRYTCENAQMAAYREVTTSYLTALGLGTNHGSWLTWYLFHGAADTTDLANTGWPVLTPFKPDLVTELSAMRDLGWKNCLYTLMKNHTPEVAGFVDDAHLRQVAGGYVYKTLGPKGYSEDPLYATPERSFVNPSDRNYILNRWKAQLVDGGILPLVDMLYHDAFVGDGYTPENSIDPRYGGSSDYGEGHHAILTQTKAEFGFIGASSEGADITMKDLDLHSYKHDFFGAAFGLLTFGYAWELVCGDRYRTYSIDNFTWIPRKPTDGDVTESIFQVYTRRMVSGFHRGVMPGMWLAYDLDNPRALYSGALGGLGAVEARFWTVWMRIARILKTAPLVRAAIYNGRPTYVKRGGFDEAYEISDPDQPTLLFQTDHVTGFTRAPKATGEPTPNMVLLMTHWPPVAAAAEPASITVGTIPGVGADTLVTEWFDDGTSESNISYLDGSSELVTRPMVLADLDTLTWEPWQTRFFEVKHATI